MVRYAVVGSVLLFIMALFVISSMNYQSVDLNTDSADTAAESNYPINKQKPGSTLGKKPIIISPVDEMENESELIPAKKELPPGGGNLS